MFGIRTFSRKLVKKANFLLADVLSKNNIGSKKNLNLSDVFFMQFDKRELRRYDIVVRYLAVEQYYGKNNVGFDLYRKMQDARVHPGYGEKAVGQFRDLIASYEERGYDSSSYIVLDRTLSLIDGSHRIALQIYHGISNIKALVMPTRNEVDYTIDWFFKKGFTDSDIDLIIAKGRELTEKMNQCFSCVIWSPAVGLSEDILRDLSYFGTVCGVKRYDCIPGEYQNIVKAIYAVDDIARWKIDKKLEHMRQQAPSLISVDLRLDFPDFRLKKATGMPLSRIGERTKKALRSRYKDRIENYFFDVILHISDNYQQADYMHRVFEPNIELPEILEALSDYGYALAKTESPYYPKEFPKRIPVGKDLDIICLEKDCGAIKELLLSFVKDRPDYELRVTDGQSGFHIRCEKQGKLIFLFDVTWEMEGLSGDFTNDAIMHREKYGGYMRLSREYEYVYRAVTYKKNRGKKHHLDYLREYRAYADLPLLKKYANMDEKMLDELSYSTMLSTAPNIGQPVCSSCCFTSINSSLCTVL